MNVYEYEVLKNIHKYFQNAFLISNIWKLEDLVNYVKNVEKTNFNTQAIYKYLDIIQQKNLIFKDKFERVCEVVVIKDFYIIQPKGVDALSSVYDKTLNFSVKDKTRLFVEHKSISKYKQKKIEQEKIIADIMSEAPDYSLDDIDMEKIQYNTNIEENNVIYASYLNKKGENDGKFRIIDQRKSKNRADERTKITGMDILSYRFEELENIAQFLKINTNNNMSKPQLVKILRNYFIDNKKVLL
jgi:beta-N-acetylglucosaminidase